jgi:hypothetical protein
MGKTSEVECKTGRIAYTVEETEHRLLVNLKTNSEHECVDIYLNGKVIGYVYTTPKDGYSTLTVFANEHKVLTVHKHPSNKIVQTEHDHGDLFEVTRFTQKYD